MQRVHNYGSFLQAYALKKILEEKGHEVVFVDYKIEPCIVQNQESLIRKYARMIRNKLLKIKVPVRCECEEKSNIVGQSTLDMLFEKEMLPLLGINQFRKERTEVDVLIIGSDEVFNCLQTNKDVGYSRELFGKDCNAKKLISFAASFGNTTLNGLRKFGIDSEITQLLNGFDQISVRDENSAYIVEQLTRRKSEKHLDPVFHYNYDHLIPINNEKKPYLVVYAYPYRIRSQEVEKIKEFAKKKGLKIFCFAGMQVNLGEFKSVDAFEMLSYIRGASYVVTDTFHGTVFSIKYNIPFVSLPRETKSQGQYGNSEKILGLLKMLGLQQRVLKSLDDLEEVIDQKIEYSEVQKHIFNYTQKGLSYLENNVK